MINIVIPMAGAVQDLQKQDIRNQSHLLMF